MASEHSDRGGDAVDRDDGDDALRAWDDPTPLWLSHHWPDEYDRCVDLGGRMVCRRCLVLYPVSFVSALVLGLVASWPERLDPWFLWLLPLPAVVEFVGEQLRLVRHRPARMVALTVLLGIGCGRLYVRYLDDQRDDLVWQVAITYLLVCLGAWMLRAFRGGGRSPAG